jgi:hypothetical protein
MQPFVSKKYDLAAEPVLFSPKMCKLAQVSREERNQSMDPNILHAVIVAALIAVGLYLLEHPKFMSSKTRLVRGVAIWVALVLALRGLDYLFMH